MCVRANKRRNASKCLARPPILPQRSNSVVLFAPKNAAALQQQHVPDYFFEKHGQILSVNVCPGCQKKYPQSKCSRPFPNNYCKTALRERGLKTRTDSVINLFLLRLVMITLRIRLLKRLPRWMLMVNGHSACKRATCFGAGEGEKNIPKCHGIIRITYPRFASHHVDGTLQKNKILTSKIVVRFLPLGHLVNHSNLCASIRLLQFGGLPFLRAQDALRRMLHMISPPLTNHANSCIGKMFQSSMSKFGAADQHKLSQKVLSIETLDPSIGRKVGHGRCKLPNAIFSQMHSHAVIPDMSNFASRLVPIHHRRSRKDP